MRSKISTSGRITILLGKHQAATGERISPRKLAEKAGVPKDFVYRLDSGHGAPRGPRRPCPPVRRAQLRVAGHTRLGGSNVSNPFDILPPNLFNIFTTQGFASLQRHYMAILIRIYSLAEFNRFGLARETVIAEIVDYLREAGANAENEIKAGDGESGLRPEPDADSLT